MSWLTKFHDAQHKAEAVRWYLENLSSLMYEVGNEKLGERLYRMQSDLSNALKQIDEAVNENFNEQVKRSNEATANMIKACLAVGMMKEEEEPDWESIPPEPEMK